MKSAAPPLPATIWVLGCVSLLMDLSSEMVHALLPVYLVGTLGVSALMVGLIDGAAEATALATRVFSGLLSDWWGRRKPLALLGYGLGAASKPLFALAGGPGLVLGARLLDRFGKGLRGAPRDALVAEHAPAGRRGEAFGLRQALDTVGAFLGPLLAVALMLAWSDDVRAVFWVAAIPGALAVLLLALGVREAPRAATAPAVNPLSRVSLARLPAAYWRLVAVGSLFALARFSEAFLLLRAQQGGLGLAWVPLVLIALNGVYAASAYPAGRLADRMDRRTLLALGLLVLVAADLALAGAEAGPWLWAGVALWGLHLGLTQGLLAAQVADAAPPALLGTAYGFFNLASGAALLLASAAAGLIWDLAGARWTFVAGAALALLALAALAVLPHTAAPAVRTAP
ncbi:MFS transporter [Rubrivivax sp. A210]|uniref:MFS transporter n=1 Tax=Rubrivivax sp. A210 TaxID=2772301 RepID=UPI0019BBD7E6|nr:MFS transporter [Rubrivivax sp. A210]CAD5373721.1 MFS transporter [Rubrivivax sp. A210]